MDLERTLGDLLELACRRILELDRPACVKNGEMRYLAVNSAYARLFARPEHEFIRHRETELFATPAAEERVAREIRVLSTGIADAMRVTDPASGRVITLEIETFHSADGAAYLYAAEPVAGMLPIEPAPLEPEGDDHPQIFFDGGLLSDDLDLIRENLENAPFPVGIFAEDGRPLVANAAFRKGEAPPTVPGPGGITLPVEQALGLLDIGIAVFSADNHLLYANQQMNAFFGPIIGPMAGGLSLEQYFTASWDFCHRHDAAETLARLGTREAYVADRLTDCDRPFTDQTIETCLGGHLRCINRRLDSGTLLMVRIDTTAEAERERRLNEQLAEIELYRNVLEELPVAVFVRDVEHRLVYANGAYGRLLGRDLAELRGRTEVEIYGEAGQHIAEINGDVLETGELSEMHDVVEDAGGAPHRVLSRANRLVASDGTTYVAGSMIELEALPGAPEPMPASVPADMPRAISTLPPSAPVRVLLIDPDERRGALAADRLLSAGIDCVAIPTVALAAAVVDDAARLQVPVDVVALGPPVESRAFEVTIATGKPTVPLTLLQSVLARAWSSQPSAPPRAGQQALLIAEDDPASLIVYTRILTELGLEHETVSSGSAAIAVWQARRPDLVLMDITLADINGYEATLAIRAIESASGLEPTVIIGLASTGSELERQRALACGMDDVLIKPVSPDLLAARLYSWLPARDSREA